MLEKLLCSLELDAILITSSANMRYVAGFTGEGYVYWSRKSKLVVTDSRYAIAAKEECPQYEVLIWGTDGYYAELLKKVQTEQVGRLGFEDQVMTVSSYESIRSTFLKETMHDIQMIPVKDGLKEFRQIKTEIELDKIRKAEEIGDRAFAKILSQLKPGITEKQVASMIEYYMKEEGAYGFSFDTIAASGLHSAMPHAVPTDKVLEEGDFLTMDFGCLYDGYCSDMTRTVVIGKANDKQKEIYETVLRAQQTALAGIRPGMKGKEIDALARNVITEAGYGKYFGHSLGHSVGIEIHESPNFSPKEEKVIEPGMVITVEPGIYIEGFGGVRIEDIVIITENGCENITHSPKQLIEIAKE